MKLYLTMRKSDWDSVFPVIYITLNLLWVLFLLVNFNISVMKYNPAMEDTLVTETFKQEDNTPNFDPFHQVRKHTYNLTTSLAGVYRRIWKKEGVCSSLACLPLLYQHIHSFMSFRAYSFGIPAYTGDQLRNPASWDWTTTGLLGFPFTVSHYWIAAYVVPINIQ